jgi:hypothetical protein
MAGGIVDAVTEYPVTLVIADTAEQGDPDACAVAGR